MKRLVTFFLLVFAFHLHANSAPWDQVVRCGTGWWVLHHRNFGMEKTTVSMPHTPVVTQNGLMSTATAWSGLSCYTFTGYYPPISNIDVRAFFDEILFSMSTYPYVLDQHRIYENTSGNWVLEYVARDVYSHLVIQSFSVVSPFNAYTLQCTHPYGISDNYTYFRDSFQIFCEYGY